MKFLSFLIQVAIFYVLGMMLVRLVLAFFSQYFRKKPKDFSSHEPRRQPYQSRPGYERVVDAEFEEVKEND